MDACAEECSGRGGTTLVRRRGAGGVDATWALHLQRADNSGLPRGEDTQRLGAGLAGDPPTAVILLLAATPEDLEAPAARLVADHPDRVGRRLEGRGTASPEGIL